MRLLGRMLVVLALLGTMTSTVRAQNFMDRWFWGVEGGVTLYRTNFSAPAADASGSTYTAAPTFGANWFITATRVALQLSFEQTWFTQVAESLIEDASSATGTRIMRSDQMRRFGATLIAIPLQNQVQPFVGMGVAIQQSGGLRPRNVAGLSAAELDAALANAESFEATAALTFLGGINYYLNQKWVLYGQYRFASGSENYLLTSSIHTFSGGVRFNFGSAREGTRSRF